MRVRTDVQPTQFSANDLWEDVGIDPLRFIHIFKSPLESRLSITRDGHSLIFSLYLFLPVPTVTFEQPDKEFVSSIHVLVAYPDI